MNIQSVIQKAKRVFYASSSTLLLVPAVAVAQFEVPGDTGLNSTPIWELINNLMLWLLLLVGFIAVIGFAISGVLYLTAAGDEDRIGQAKRAMIASIIGVIVALLGLVILSAVNTFYGGETRF
ncbi:MAG: hypothetical protein KC736_02190 [Candidatus Moranbacteria bacterium]|nr:hypothetical protein [Candidatus Moranbacteria bacterium]